MRISRVAAFSEPTLRTQLRLDAVLRWGALVSLIVIFVQGSATGSTGNFVMTLLTLLAGGLWVGTSLISANVAQSLGRINDMLDHNPASAEAVIASGLARKPLARSVRLALYHRVAVLRHRQQRFAESAAICRSLLAMDQGRSLESRPHLLLMLVEADLHTGDINGAYQALLELHQIKLRLGERLQLLALQTRYELTIGQDAAAVANLQQKVAMAEMMPAPQCGMLHAMLSSAAARLGQHDRSTWLGRRAQLLCTAEQLGTWDVTWIARGQTEDDAPTNELV
jgi:hypothetical protein